MNDGPRPTLRAASMPRGLRRSIVLSVVVHVVVVLGLVVATSGLARSKRSTQTVITTKLVRLGKERPKEFLPRKQELPPPAARSIAAAASDKASPKSPSGKDGGEKQSLTDALSRLKRSSSADEPEGHADGVVDGEVSSLAEALVGNRYTTEIYKCVKANYAIEGIPPEKIKGKSAMIFIRVQGDGTFFDIKLETGSGLAAFDRAVEKAIKRCGRVSPPPKEILERVREDGIEFEFRP
ncbi:MAG: TonB C-terminal domain-containing protein [Deltaproteobacteria bacterium]|nr:TonB C-terminal domain-containing protein [Deltaproteobacteria bacterium]